MPNKRNVLVNHEPKYSTVLKSASISAFFCMSFAVAIYGVNLVVTSLFSNIDPESLWFAFFFGCALYVKKEIDIFLNTFKNEENSDFPALNFLASITVVGIFVYLALVIIKLI